MKDLRERLSGRIFAKDLRELCLWACEEANEGRKECLYRLTVDEDDRVAYNALWVWSHFPASDLQWLLPRQQELIDRAMAETHGGRKRLLLTLLERLPFAEKDLRVDFIDFCLHGILSADEATGYKALCIKLAYKQCRYYEELRRELITCLDWLATESLQPGIGTARRNVLRKLIQK